MYRRVQDIFNRTRIQDKKKVANMVWKNIPTHLEDKQFKANLNEQLSIVISILNKKADYTSISGTFATTDGKTITLVNGIVTNMV